MGKNPEPRIEVWMTMGIGSKSKVFEGAVLQNQLVTGIAQTRAAAARQEIVIEEFEINANLVLELGLSLLMVEWRSTLSLNLLRDL